MKKEGAWFALERKDDDITELIASRLEVLGPVSAKGLETADADSILIGLETQGRILRGYFTPGTPEIEWCDRRLLARIHRYTLSRLRAEIEPASAADFMRFLTHWQHIAGEDHLHESDGLALVVEQLEGFERRGRVGARRRRGGHYGAEQLDRLRLRPRRLAASRRGRKHRFAPAHLAHVAQARRGWRSDDTRETQLSAEATAAHGRSEARRIAFHEIVANTAPSRRWSNARSRILPARASPLPTVSPDRAPSSRRRRTLRSVEAAGRWSLLAEKTATWSPSRALLKRYGVVFRAMLMRETLFLRRASFASIAG